MRTESDYVWLQFRNCTGRATDAILFEFSDYEPVGITDPLYPAILKLDADAGLESLKPLWDNSEFKAYFSYDNGLTETEYTYAGPIPKVN